MSKKSNEWDGVKVDDDPRKTAASVGCYVEEPLGNELQIDLDHEGDWKHVETGLKILVQHGIAASLGRITTSRSGNKHVRVVFPRHLTAIERIALQACLGSDRIREVLSLVRVFNDINRPATCFFEPLAVGASK